MRVTPKSEKEVMEAGLWEKGVYDFEISTAIDKISKAQNEMIELNVQVFNQAGESKYVYDYLLDDMARKVRHVAIACGLLDKYESGALLAEDFAGKTGQCKLAVQKDKTGQYADKNIIVDYVIKTDGAAPVRAETVATGAVALDDEIPF